MAHIRQTSVPHAARDRVPAGARASACGGRRIVWLARYRDPERIEEVAGPFERQQDAEDFLEALEASGKDPRRLRRSEWRGGRR